MSGRSVVIRDEMDMGCNEGLVRLADCAGAEELGCSVGGDGSSAVIRCGADMFGCCGGIFM